MFKPRIIKRNKRPSWSRCGDLLKAQAALRTWYQAFPGTLLQETENEVLSEVLPTLFGYHLLKIGLWENNQALKSSKIPHQILMDRDACVDKGEGTIACPASTQAVPEALPFQADSLDVVILAHSLEFAAEPHQVLREVERCLIPEGHVVLMAFNPNGLWTLWRLLLGWKGRPPWCGRFIRPARLKDWLQLLGFDVVDARYYFYRPPLKQRGMMKRLSIMERIGRHWWTPVSGAYLMVAKKRVATLTPLKPRWRARRRRLVAPGLAGTSSISPNTTSENNGHS